MSPTLAPVEELDLIMLEEIEQSVSCELCDEKAEWIYYMLFCRPDCVHLMCVKHMEHEKNSLRHFENFPHVTITCRIHGTTTSTVEGAVRWEKL